MALQEKTRLNNMLSGQDGKDAASAAATPGKQALDGQSDHDHEAGFGISGAKEGGEGTKGAAAPPPAAPAGKAAGGKITVSTAPAAGNPSTARTAVGVGEKVTFTAGEEGTWTIGEKELGTGQTIEWTAPDTLALANVVHTPFLTSPTKPSSIPMMVMQPSTIDFKKTGNVAVSGPGMAGVGMTTTVTVGPTNVSFGAAEWFEQPGAAEGVSGYFAAYVASGQSLAHKPNPAWLPMGANNNDVHDNAWTKDKPKLLHPTDKTQRWWGGSFHWTIPNHYRVKGGASHLINYVTQSFVMDDAGAITVTKGGASATSKPDNAVDGDLEKYPTRQDAMAMLEIHGRAGCVQAVMNYKRNPKADPASVANLVAALASINLELYTFVTCKNTYGWTDPDEVVMTASAKKSATGKSTKINTGEGKEMVFSLANILDYGSMSTGDVINFNASVDGGFAKHAHSATLAYPYNMKDVQMAGSDRYTITARIR
ncbi:MAG: hypothetical protein NT062_32450 [Proteobacteria bacterium]|nr:hypothetical protein [Pseudomonadota bacterium]